MASAKQEAMNKLGNVNDFIGLNALNEERKVANNTYNTNKTSLQNEYNNLVNTLNNSRTATRQDFNKGRGTVRENAFMRNRGNVSDLATRGVSGGGLRQLNELGNRMEVGRQYSDLANTYYNSMKDIDATEKTGRESYNTNLDRLKNTLDSNLAGIGSREAAGRNAYNQAVAGLAEQIAARRQAAADAAAARAQAAQAMKLREQEMKMQKNKEINAYFNDIMKGKYTNADEAIKAANKYATLTGGTTQDGLKYLYNSGLYNPDKAMDEINNRGANNRNNNFLSKSLNFLGDQISPQGDRKNSILYNAADYWDKVFGKK